LESWSKYESFIDIKTIEESRDILRKGHDINQMMMVVGEEGTSMDDFEIYLKSEFLDSVYLQQNAFDPVDAASNQERQKHMFQVVKKVLDTDFRLETKEEARTIFYRLRQLFIDWNYIDMQATEFKTQEDEINKLIEEHSENEKGV
jgi:V/A-type H+-transporting ATPase subunit A